jgi:subtilisin family serine protease
MNRQQSKQNILQTIIILTVLLLVSSVPASAANVYLYNSDGDFLGEQTENKVKEEINSASLKPLSLDINETTAKTKVIIRNPKSQKGILRRIISAKPSIPTALEQLDETRPLPHNLVLAEVTPEELESLEEEFEVYPNNKYSALLEDSVSLTNTPTYWEQGFRGDGIKIAILDTGIDSDHPMLTGKVITAQDFMGDNPEDFFGHGTHVAGIAAGKKVNNEGFNGVAPNALLLNAKVLDNNGDGSTASILEGIYWAIDPDNNPSTNDQADIISLSLGAASGNQDILLNEALQEAIDKGIVVVVASGNCGPQPSATCRGYQGVTVPGKYKEVITVGAVSNTLAWASFSSGEEIEDYIKPDVVAPGVGITSSVVEGYETKDGTSASTPFVAGMAALLLEEDNSRDHYAIKQLLEETALDLGDTGKDVQYGSGFVQLFFDDNADEETNETTEERNNETSVSENREDFSFIEIKNSSSPVGKSTLDTVDIYEKDQKPVYIRKIAFQNALDLTEYLYNTFPLNSPAIELVNSEYNYIAYDNQLLWYTQDTAYVVTAVHEDINPFLDAYSQQTENLVGANVQEHKVSLKALDDQAMQVLAQYHIEFFETDKEVNVSPQWGGKTPDEADTITFGSDYTETFWTAREDNWYYTETSLRGPLTFGIRDIDSGDDLDLYVYDYQASNPMCSSGNGGNADDVCTVSKPNNNLWGFYINVYPYTIGGLYAEANVYTSGPSCTEEWLAARECRAGNKVYGEWRNSDCTTEMKSFNLDCDVYDTETDWDYYCSSNKVKKKRTVYDYSCSDGTCSGPGTTETETVTTCESYELCQDNGGTDVSCRRKTCEELGYIGSCTDISDSDCRNNGVYECDDVLSGIPYQACYVPSTQCTASQVCEEGWPNAECKDITCELSSAAWSRSRANEGETVSLTLQGNSACNGKTTQFTVWEVDCGYDYSSQADCDDEQVQNNPNSVTFNNGQTTTTWTAEWQYDGINSVPEYYFIANVEGRTLRSSTPDFEVDRVCTAEASYQCSDGNVHWYNSCGEKGEIKENCETRGCVDNACVEEIPVTSCGDSICSEDETQASCPQDCFVKHQLTIESITPQSARENDEVTVTVKIKNIGTIADGSTNVRNIEVGIVPESWAGQAYPSAYSIQEIIDGIPVCGDNTFYDTKVFDIPLGNTETATFTMTAPSQESIDACNELGSAWDDTFRVIAGTYSRNDGGVGYDEFESQPYVVNPGNACTVPDGTPGCMCPTDKSCPVGYQCNNGACEVVQETCDLPDGTSRSCDCDSNKECNVYGNYICELGPGWDACIPYNEPDECTIIDEFSCGEGGNVYRCEQVGSRKKLVLSDVCTVHEICPANVATQKQCASTLTYDVIVEQASAGTIVNKQPGDTLFITVDAEASGSVNFAYDQSIFSLTSGNCGSGSFSAGKNACEFIVDGNANSGRHTFTINGDIETVNVLDSPHTLYITNTKQLHRRYNDFNGVNVLLAKVYEKAWKNKGVVYDLDREVHEEHPFDYEFGLYDQKLDTASGVTNQYSEAVGKFVHSTCKTCRSVVVVGDDYVVPNYRSKIMSREDNLNHPEGLIDYWFRQNKPRYLLNDLSLIKKQMHFAEDGEDDIDNLFDLSYMGRTNNQGKEVYFIVPDTMSSEMRNAYNELRQTVQNLPMNPDIYEKRSAEVDCQFHSWTFDGGHILGWRNYLKTFDDATVIIIGNRENNNALGCYPFIQNIGTDIDKQVLIQPSVWDASERAILVGDSELAVKSFSLFLRTGTYEHFRSYGWVVLDSTVLAGSIALLPFTGGGSVAGIAPRMLLIVGGLEVLDIVSGCHPLVLERNINEKGSCLFAVLPAVPAGTNKVLKAIGLDKATELIMKKMGKKGFVLADKLREQFSILANKLTPARFNELMEVYDAYDEYVVEIIARKVAKLDVDIVLLNAKAGDGVLLEFGGVVNKHKDDALFIDAAAKLMEKDPETAKKAYKLIANTDGWTTAKVNQLNKIDKENIIPFADSTGESASTLMRRIKVNALIEYPGDAIPGSVYLRSVNNEGYKHIGIYKDNTGRIFYFKPNTIFDNEKRFENYKDKIFSNVDLFIHNKQFNVGPRVIMKKKMLSKFKHQGSMHSGLVVEGLDNFGNVNVKTYDEWLKEVLPANPGEDITNRNLRFINAMPKDVRESLEKNFVLDYLFGAKDRNPGGLLFADATGDITTGLQTSKIAIIDSGKAMVTNDVSRFLDVPDFEEIFASPGLADEKVYTRIKNLWRNDKKEEVLTILEEPINGLRTLKREDFSSARRMNGLTPNEEEELQLIENILFGSRNTNELEKTRSMLRSRLSPDKQNMILDLEDSGVLSQGRIKAMIEEYDNYVLGWNQ